MGALFKFLLVIGVVALLAWWLFGARARRSLGRRAERELPPPEGMLRCAHCGVHLPRSEALLLGGQAYCSAAHRDAGPREPHD